MKKALLVLFVSLVVVVIVGCGGNLSSTSTKNTDPVPRTITTDSGLQYQDIKEGTGNVAAMGAVTINYITFLENGTTKVQSTMDPGGVPIEIILGNKDLTAGMDEGVNGMRVGGQRRLMVTPQLAYGAEGKAPSIPADASLVYYVEVVSVRPWTALANGLKYIDLTVGTGADVASNSKIKVNYTGWLSNGMKFESSLDPGGSPIEFTLGQQQVIDGWDQGIPGMKVGGKRRLWIPPDLAYGSSGSPPSIPPNATLVFDVSVVEVL